MDLKESLSFYRKEQGLSQVELAAVSYPHLTLPTN